MQVDETDLKELEYTTEDNWDNEGAKAISRSVFEDMEHFMQMLPDDITLKPVFNPNSGGSIDLSWFTRQGQICYDMDVGICGDDRYEYWAYCARAEVINSKVEVGMMIETHVSDLNMSNGIHPQVLWYIRKIQQLGEQKNADTGNE